MLNNPKKLKPLNNALKLTRLAGEKGGLPCLQGCPKMSRVLPEPPGSLARSRC